METYTYEAATKEGGVVTGTIEAVNQNSAVDRIQEQGYFPLKISKTKAKKSSLSDVFSFLQNRVGENDLTAGFPLERALFVISELTDKPVMKELIQDILSLVRSGKSFSESLSKFPSVFPLFYANMIKAGEAGGFLEDTISQMAVYLENSQALKSDVRSALIYPTILLFFGTLAVIVLLTFVVPKFSVIFSDLGENLPLPTIILLAISNTIKTYWWLLLLSSVGGFFGMRHYLRSESGKQSWDRFRFRSHGQWAHSSGAVSRS
jgi:general secretion pathway protein F